MADAAKCFTPWHAIYQHTQRWIKAGCFEAMAHDLRTILRLETDSIAAIAAPRDSKDHLPPKSFSPKAFRAGVNLTTVPVLQIAAKASNTF